MTKDSETKSLHLGVWSSDTAISNREAAELYVKLREGRYKPDGFDGEVYAFYCQLILYYPEIDLVPEPDLDGCPWACALEVSDRYVIMSIQRNKSANVIPLVLALAEQHGLVCFDPQAGKVHLPSRLDSRAQTG